MKNTRGKLLFVLGLIALFIGIAAVICAIVFEFLGNEELLKVFEIIVSIAGPVAIALLVFKFILFGGTPSPEPSMKQPKTFQYNKKDIPITDVKEIKKSQDEIMYEKYEDLYKQGIITKEDLEKKRIELLGK